MAKAAQAGRTPEQKARSIKRARLTRTCDEIMGLTWVEDYEILGG